VSSSPAAPRRPLLALLLGFARIVGAAAVLVAAAGVLGGASCRVRSSCDDDDGFDDDDDAFDDDDDDCGDDDDDGFFSSTDAEGTAALGPEVDWTLREYRLSESDDLGAHSVSSLSAIRGFSLTSKLGPGVFGDAELTAFTANVLKTNEALIGVAPEHGRLRFDAIEHQQHFTFVNYAQELVDERDVATAVPGALLTFVFDLHGRLIEIDNATRIDVP